MDEHVSPATIWLNEAIALRRAEPFHRPLTHFKSPSNKNNDSTDVILQSI
jgi:hypothetical protein